MESFRFCLSRRNFEKQFGAFVFLKIRFLREWGRSKPVLWKDVVAKVNPHFAEICRSRGLCAGLRGRGRGVFFCFFTTRVFDARVDVRRAARFVTRIRDNLMMGGGQFDVRCY